MCGRFTVKTTWAEIVALYKLTLDRLPHNPRPSFNVCPKDPVDVVTEEDGKRDFVHMRWGLVPRWWPKLLKELRAATFNARGDSRNRAVLPRCVKKNALPDPSVGHYEWKNEAGTSSRTTFRAAT